MWARRRLEWITAVVAAVLAVAYTLAPRMGSDLAAQTARALFFAGHGYTPVDLRWYAGVDQLGYSLVSQPLMALFGVRVTGALALIVTAVLFAILARRTGAARPWLGALAGTVCIAANLVSGRVTYALGVMLAIAALTALTASPRLRLLAPVAAFLASATSPVAGLFVGLAGVALLLSSRVRTGLGIAVPAAVPLIVTAGLLGDGGWMNISHADIVRAMIASLAVAAVVPIRPVRIGAVLSAAGVLAAGLIHTPVGLNATRLAVMFAVPVLAGWAVLPRRVPRLVLVGVLLVVCFVEPPVVTADIEDIGNPTADRAYFAPLIDRLGRERLTGRVEIPSTRDYWEAAYLGDIPLARGWLRQADIDRNPLFFTTIPGASGTGVPLDATTYRDWLARQAVQFVAVPDAVLTWSGKPEAALVGGGLPYLTEVWSGAHWRLYAVADPQPIVGAPGSLTGYTAASLTIDAPAAGDIEVRVRYYRWLHASGQAVVRRSGAWTVLHVPGPGRYELTS
ncbi:hypothetical protein ACIA5C_28475 [Actinoplanes sp. NPDC051343]|uniref:hypothetical protein n=1 Tax=Actinoplanes sp. NPDC051343 TaxID=3363906 RepID=UPI0037A79BD3